MTNKQITSQNVSVSTNAPDELESAKEFGALERTLPVFWVYSWARSKWRAKLKNPESKVPWAFSGTREDCIRFIAKRVRRDGPKAYDDLMIVDKKNKTIPWTVKEIHELEEKRNALS